MDGQSNIAKCSGRFLLDGIVFSTVEENEREEVGKREGEGCGGGGGFTDCFIISNVAFSKALSKVSEQPEQGPKCSTPL